MWLSEKVLPEMKGILSPQITATTFWSFNHATIERCQVFILILSSSSLNEWGPCIASPLVLSKGCVMILCHWMLSSSIVCHSNFHRRRHRVCGFILKPWERRHRALCELTQGLKPCTFSLEKWDARLCSFKALSRDGGIQKEAGPLEAGCRNFFMSPAPLDSWATPIYPSV